MKFIFLDRDGVINTDPREKLYITAWKDFQFLPGVLEALRDLAGKGYKIIIVSNQSCGPHAWPPPGCHAGIVLRIKTAASELL